MPLWVNRQVTFSKCSLSLVRMNMPEVDTNFAQSTLSDPRYPQLVFYTIACRNNILSRRWKRSTNFEHKSATLFRRISQEQTLVSAQILIHPMIFRYAKLEYASRVAEYELIRSLSSKPSGSCLPQALLTRWRFAKIYFKKARLRE
jgi:hypothetical protein